MGGALSSGIDLSVNDPVRKVRRTRATKQTETPRSSRTDGPRTWRKVIEGVVEINVEEAHAKLEKDLRLRGPVTLSALQVAIEEAVENFLLAAKVEARARADYESYKEHHAEWLEDKKRAARKELEEAKKAQKLTKQITNDMIEDRVRSSVPEYMDRKKEYLEFQAAVHVLSDLKEAWRIRANRSLSDQKELIKLVGATAYVRRGEED